MINVEIQDETLAEAIEAFLSVIVRDHNITSESSHISSQFEIEEMFRKAAVKYLLVNKS